MKYKIVGWADLILGVFGFVQQAIALLIVYPKVSVLYEDFGAELPMSTVMYPYTTGVSLIILAGVILVGWKLVFGKNPGNKIFGLGIAGLILVIVGWGFYSGLTMMSLVNPVYSVSGK